MFVKVWFTTRAETSNANCVATLEAELILRWQEVAVPLFAVLVLIILKHVPATADLPLARTAGVICFGYAIFLALRLVQGTEAVSHDGWHQLQASPVQLFGILGASAISALLLGMVLTGGQSGELTYGQMATSMAMSLFFAGIAVVIGLFSILVKVRWNRSIIEHMDGFGKRTTLAWADVAGVTSHWRGITIWSHDRRRISFSPYHSGAPQLARFAAQKAQRNATSAARAFAS